MDAAPRASFDWAANAKRLQWAAREFYLNNGGTLTAGQLFRAPMQSEVLRCIALERRSGFYDGEVVEDMVASLQAMRGIHMLADETAAKLAALIDPIRAMGARAALSENVHKDTVYLTVVDKDQMAVSLIYYAYYAFGACLASGKFGILFQNRGAGFNLTAGHANEVGGGKRPMHTIIAGMLKQGGGVIMPFGVMGGAYQSNGHTRFLINMFDFGLHPHAATPEGAIGGAQAIQIDHDTGVLIGASDPRKDGCALGY